MLCTRVEKGEFVTIDKAIVASHSAMFQIEWTPFQWSPTPAKHMSHMSV